MRKRLVISFVMVFMFIGAVTVRGEGLGVGIVLGEPTGLSGKMWLGGNTAIAGAAAWSFGNNGAIHVHTDYLFHNNDLLDFASLYYGIGVKIKLMNDVLLGIRIPVGLVHKLEAAPIDIFFEIVPGLNLIPNTGFGANGGLGARYYF